MNTYCDYTVDFFIVILFSFCYEYTGQPQLTSFWYELFFERKLLKVTFLSTNYFSIYVLRNDMTLKIESSDPIQSKLHLIILDWFGFDIGSYPNRTKPHIVSIFGSDGLLAQNRPKPFCEHP